MPEQRNAGRPDEDGLIWCHSCGDRVPQVGVDDQCPLCEELDARLDAQVGAAMEDFAERAIGLLLDYLHPDDLQDLMGRVLRERGSSEAEVGRLRDRWTRAHGFLDERAARALCPPPEPAE